MLGLKQESHRLIWLMAILLLCCVFNEARAAGVIEHRLQVEIHPVLKLLKVKDQITLPAGFAQKSLFYLNKKIKITTSDKTSRIRLVQKASGAQSFNEWILERGSQKVSLEYSGIFDFTNAEAQSYGLISQDGAALLDGSYWFPQFTTNDLLTFDLTLTTPNNWVARTQGQQLSKSTLNSATSPQMQTHWSQIYPQQNIYIFAGPFKEYEKTSEDNKTVHVLLRREDQLLADNFLNLIPGYIEHYSQEVAPYPYSDFTVIENFWETGLAYPSFTLLGSSVIRLPFILNSSLPHEILHNWWGNSVYVDPQQGNWSEGLTTYMSDHWQQEIVHKDTDYRLQNLIEYEDYIKSSNDMTLNDFKEKQDAGTQAVGYSKAMMFFHMLKKEFGEDTFRKALQDFYSQNKFQLAGYNELQLSFEKVLKKPLVKKFAQWIQRTGAPDLQFDTLKVMPLAEGGYKLVIGLSQQQQGELYDLSVPVVVRFADESSIEKSFNLKDKRQSLSFTVGKKPKSVEIDPNFDLFRQLAAEEHPATFSALLSADEVHFYYEKSQLQAPLFVESLRSHLSAKFDVTPVDQDLNISATGVLVFIGDDTRFSALLKNQLAEQNFEITDDGISIDNTNYVTNKSSWMISARSKTNPQQVFIWIRWNSDMNPSNWAERLTHYGKYGALVFEGQPNTLKMNWPILNSPLKKQLP